MTRARQEGNLSIADREHIDELCVAFEDQWLQGNRPLVEDYLAGNSGPIRAALLHELLLIELEYRRGWGEQPVISDYLPRFRDGASEIRRAFAKTTSRRVNMGFLPGHSIGRYRIKSKLGAGAFGTVYLAWDEQLHRDVAIKVPHHCQLDSYDQRDRFLKEARVLAGLKHPGIVPVYDSGRLDDDRVYLVMQYVKGQSLRERMNTARLDVNQAVNIVADAADAVHGAHRTGVVHRDLKPANILLDNDGRVHVADFGLAICDKDANAGEYAGTLAYMAPEQLQRSAGTTDARADIWALGVILYELLCGRIPYEGPSGRVVVERVLSESAPPIRRFTRRVSRQLADVCHRCLAKRPHERPDSAAELAAKLRECIRPRHARSATLIAGLTLSGLLLLVMAVHRWDSSSYLFANTTTRVDLNAVDVVVWNPNLDTGDRLRMSQHAHAAVYADDCVRLEIKLASPAFVYVVWIDSTGTALPVYPWQKGDWSQRDPNESLRRKLSLPSGTFDYWTMESGPAGMETVVLLARRSPLPESVSMKNLLSEFRNHAVPLQKGIWRFVNGQKFSPKQRGPDLQQTATVRDPLDRLQWRLVDVLRPHFDLVQTISFPFRAEQSSREMVSSFGAKSLP